ncbi:hypothetical protein evm_014158 [Chilo suppressalis]|nr:hypothetical protein evm_014158 [Chilo suppressalis]
MRIFGQAPRILLYAHWTFRRVALIKLLTSLPNLRLRDDAVPTIFLEAKLSNSSTIPVLKHTHNILEMLKLTYGKTVSYADDTVLLFSAKTVAGTYDAAQNGLNRVMYWLRSSNLTLNAEKTKCIYFTMRNENLSDKTQQQLPELRFHSNCNLALCQSLLTYGITIWGGMPKTNLKSVEVAQRAVLKVYNHHHHHQPINVPTAWAQAFPMDGIGRSGHDPPRGPSADWRVLTTADAAGTNGLTCLPKHGGARDSNFWSPIQ